MPKKIQDYYTMLGLSRFASQNEIRNAYLKAAKRLHPDKNVGPGETELFMDIQQAYQVLSNPPQRSAYDANLPPEEAPGRIKQSFLISRSSLSPLNEKQLAYVLIDLTPTEETIAENISIPLNICLVLDCSTSMNGEKLNMVKAATIQLLEILKPQDIFSVVTFNDRAEVVIPATRQANKHKTENQIRKLKTSGGTEMLQGLKAGLEEINRYHNPKYTNHIILLTDGHTYGDEQACYAMAKDAAVKKIGISAMGIGNDWNDAFLDQLTNLTGGHSMLVSHADDIERLLTERVSKLSKTFADNVIFEYTLRDGVEISYAFRLLPETDPIGCENPMQFGPILHDWPLSILLELIIHPSTVDDKFITLLEGKIEISANGIEAPLPFIPVNLFLPLSNAGTPETPPLAIIQALSKLTLYRMQEKARSEVAAGNFAKATQHLQRLATHLLTQGEKSLAKTVMLEIEHIETQNKYSGQGEKQIKYGTRALLLLPEEKTR